MSIAHGTAFPRSSDSSIKLLGLAILGGALVSCNATTGSAPTSSPVQGHNSEKVSSTASFWPDGKRAAVSLAYDDALASQRINAIEQLGRHHLSASFFLKGASDDLKAHRPDWQAMVAKGHELAAHTTYHPCDRSFDWVKKGYALQDYDLARMEAELEENVQLLGSLGAQTPYTFCYPCGQTQVGEEPQTYEGLVTKRFIASRLGVALLVQPTQVDLNRVPNADGAQPKEQLLALVEQAEAEGAWIVFGFHGVGGDYIAVELEAHEALLQALEARADRVWTAPFGKVAAYVREMRR